MARPHHTEALVRTEDTVTVLFCLIDDAYSRLNPRGEGYESLKRLSDSEVLTLALFQQLRGVESEQSFLRDAGGSSRTCSPVSWGFTLPPSTVACASCGASWSRCGAPSWRISLATPETLIADSTLLSVLHPRQVPQSAGFDGAVWVCWGSFCVYGVKLHLVCTTNRVPVSFELTAANVAEVLLVWKLLAGANLLAYGAARRLPGDPAYRSGALKEQLAQYGVLLATEPAERRRSERQHVEVCFVALKRTFGLGGTLATTLVGLATRIAAKVCVYTYGCYVNRLFGRPQGHIKELWA